ncbi:hypothetical protein PoB_000827000 [Plakobranchus ocellatus]|uniref:Peptidase A2 domain-containing protein n=1 Tax=Plakobranchus ocellatus TaxID=259542 RepID=A0AAV3YGB9_9GAST|nr:hypothetical protein PoB_000827000 [Plakobranchus ocellatus]
MLASVKGRDEREKPVRQDVTDNQSNCVDNTKGFTNPRVIKTSRSFNSTLKFAIKVISSNCVSQTMLSSVIFLIDFQQFKWIVDNGSQREIISGNRKDVSQPEQ